jgi:hypothetical protein
MSVVMCLLVQGLAVSVLLPRIGLAADGATSNIVRISVNYPRALSVVIDEIRRRHGVAISYEDPPYEYPGDVVDVTQWVRRDLDQFPDGQAPPVVFPRMCRFQTEYEVDPVTGDPTNLMDTLRTVVSAYNSGDNPGKFKVENLPLGPCIVPTQVRDVRGEWRNVQPLLSTPISLDFTNVSNRRALSAFLSVLGSNTTVEVIGSAVMQERGGLSIMVENEAARAVLTRLLQDPAYGGVHNFWNFNYGPKPQCWVLNLNRAVRGPVHNLGEPEWAVPMRTSGAHRAGAELGR